MHLRALPLLLLSLTFLASACKKAPEPAPAAPDPTSPPALAAAAKRTHERMIKQAARWTAVHHLESGDRIEVAMLEDAPNLRRRVEFSLLRGDERIPMTRIVEKDGRWFVTDGEISGVYRPYMAPLRNPAFYLYLAKSQLQFFQEAAAASLGPLSGVEKDIATFRVPFSEALIEALDARAAEAEAADAGSAAEEIRTAKAEGLQTRVSLSTGILTRTGLPGLQTEVEGPHFFVSPPNDTAFDVGERSPGLLAEPLEGQTDSLVMLGHCLTWRPGMRPCDLDTHLLDLDNGALRRVPFVGGTSLPGTFLRNRSEVVVSGTDLGGGMRPFRVHLDAGAQLPLGGSTLLEGITLFPRLSPDGTMLVAIWMPAMGAHEEAQVVRFDLEGNDAVRIGEPGPYSHVQWLPDGERFLLVKRETTPSSGEGEDVKAATSTPILIAMDGDGAVTRLREGDQPLVVDEDAMLFFDVATKHWQRAKLDGSGARPFGNGHADLSAPSLSPDGQTLIFLRRTEQGVMEPVRVDTTGRKVTSVMPELGLWAWPRW